MSIILMKALKKGNIYLDWSDCVARVLESSFRQCYWPYPE